MAGVWTFFVLVASVGSNSNPVMKYSFCPLSNVQCTPTTFASNSSFEFGNISSGVYFYESGEGRPLSVSCTFHEPLHWILTGRLDHAVKPVSTNVTIYGSRLLYYYHILFNDPTHGLIRCESYENRDVAAEIYIAIENEGYDHKYVEHWLLKYFPALPMRGGQLIVPCAMARFDSDFDASANRLKKIRREHMIALKMTPECFSCFPHDDETCTTSCPYGISQRTWNETGRSLGLNKTGNQWLDCVRDPTCAFETITKVPELGNGDCNSDGETTCSDRFSAVSSYPGNCERGQTSFRNFVNIEGCVVKDQAAFRKSNRIAGGERINGIDPRFFGQMIKNPGRSGVAQCLARANYDTGYIWDLQHFFTGLDTKIYFVSSDVPAEAVISLKKLSTNLTESSGFEIEVECTIATFIVFPNFEFLLEYANGTFEQKLGYQPPESTESPEEDSQLATQRLTEYFENGSSVVSIRCRAFLRHSTKQVQAILNIKPPDDSLLSELDSNSPKIDVVVVLAVASCIILLWSATCAFYAVRKYKVSKDLRQLTMEEMDEFWNGNSALATISSRGIAADCIGFPESFQIPPCDLKINMQEVLGQGEFGLCVKGDFHGRKVAVKTTKVSMNVEAFKDFLREVKIMAYLEEHENIVEFLGAVVNQLRDCVCLAVFELSPYGDLLSYLRKQDPKNPSNVTLYVNQSDGRPCSGTEDPTLGINILSYFCEQIAAAMEFVGEKRVIHGDLAARNVLVFPDYIVKVTDFGLSRKLYTASNYKKKHGTPLPWRWMAIESFKYMEFSPMTDMWAYGVTVWEIFTMGQVPYAGLVYSLGFVDEINGGRRLACPKNASEEIYQFMKLTWDRIPAARPSFEDARIFFRRTSLGIS